MGAAVRLENMTVGTLLADTDLLAMIADHAADDKDLEAITSHLNKAVDYGELPGVANPRVGRDGRVYDERNRPYALSEIAALLATDDVQTIIAQIKENRAAQVKQEKRQARVQQLAEARRKQAAMAEEKAAPLLYAQVQHLTEVVAILVDQLDRQIGSNLKGVEVERLPELELKY